MVDEGVQQAKKAIELDNHVRRRTVIGYEGWLAEKPLKKRPCSPHTLARKSEGEPKATPNKVGSLESLSSTRATIRGRTVGRWSPK